MSERAIAVEHLGKSYSIRSSEKDYKYVALRDVLTSTIASPLRWLRRPRQLMRPSTETFWALKDVSFEVNEGEVVGIIGRNGAGKSTLLKILSRITEPTEGRVTIDGLVASLLEVGTGFHPELTGRENIFLNGAILGMRRSEIARKFDEIVAFAEVEKFLEVPVKRFSSGMYVRLAFAVAAHLEPEILIVDEVLAVGDAEFQRKCLGKMQDVASTNGRTVLFVSHNMQAIQSLCTRTLVMRNGQVQFFGSTPDAIGHYLSQAAMLTAERTWSVEDAPGDGDAKLLAVRVLSQDQKAASVASTRESLVVELEFVGGTANSGFCVGFDLITAEGITVLRTYQTDQPEDQWPALRLGSNRWQCHIPPGLLNGGVYFVCPRLSIHNVKWIVHLDSVVEFEMMLDHGVSPLWNSLNGSSRPGSVSPILRWTLGGEQPDPVPVE